MATSRNPLKYIMHPLVAWVIAAAAIAVLIFWPKPKPVERTIVNSVPYPAAIIPVVLPEDFQKENPLKYSSPTSDIYVLAHMMVKPKLNHSYNLYLLREPGDSTVIELFNHSDYDSLGQATFMTQTEVGQFSYKIQDIAGNDTTVTQYPFEVIYEP